MDCSRRISCDDMCSTNGQSWRAICKGSARGRGCSKKKEKELGLYIPYFLPHSANWIQGAVLGMSRKLPMIGRPGGPGGYGPGRCLFLQSWPSRITARTVDRRKHFDHDGSIWTLVVVWVARGLLYSKSVVGQEEWTAGACPCQVCAHTLLSESTQASDSRDDGPKIIWVKSDLFSTDPLKCSQGNTMTEMLRASQKDVKMSIGLKRKFEDGVHARHQ